MASLIHNQTFRILEGDLSGIYRVILAEVPAGCTIVALIEKFTDPECVSARTLEDIAGKKKAASPLCGKLLWLKTDALAQLAQQSTLHIIDLERENFMDSLTDLERYEKRKKIMASFLHFDSLRASIRSHGSIGRLVTNAVTEHGISRTLVYKCWSLLCRYGFSEESLRSRLDRCGAPGKVRNCSPTGRRKPGRKTNAQRLARHTGQPDAQLQPGMSAEWRQLIMMADRKIRAPKPRFPKRFRDIIAEGFTKHFREVDGTHTPVPVKFGEYPNADQVRRVLEVEIPELQRLLDTTTKGHFQRSMRGMKARSWKGVSGPGHTWQIDSTIADIYLRSSINRAWIIGRPILYIMVDVWSTAIMGFYVCLRGPSWEMAKTAIFSSLASSELLGDLWGYPSWQTLYPFPGLPSVLLCDRGEYLSLAAKETAFSSFDRISYAPPYRPDLKGLVEVLHRITKDHQYWYPGAIDARRAEYELRKFDSSKAIFTVAEYAALLHNIFTTYNLTADRTKRLDTHMISAGVVPSPAGLWRWGHEAGIGTLRHRPPSELIQLLLPQSEAKVTREGVNFDRLAYSMDDAALCQWTEKARNFGGWTIPIHHFPGSVSRIWTPNMAGAGLLELKLTDQANAAPTQTYEEVLEAFAHGSLRLPETRHNRLVLQMEYDQRSKKLTKGAQQQTAKAIEQHKGPSPSLLEARKLETFVAEQPASMLKVPEHQGEADDESDAYFEMMKSVLHAKGR
ncbi:DDE-type integrase/transposase/recombinase [Oxalobacteraceae bacterium]|nr:DDE-type integrase/transposase/recombinase [Oxalobacteraceae bacterium]